MQRWAALLIGLMFLIGSAQADPEQRQASITYVTGSSIYLDAGLEDGLQVGSTVQLLRDGEIVLTLQVQHVSSRRASCDITGIDHSFAVGDTLLFAPGEALAAAPANAATDPQSAALRDGSRASSWLRAHGLRGRVGASYLGVDDQFSKLNQPQLALRVDGRDIDQRPLDMTVDLRTRRSFRSSDLGGDSQEGRSRVYRAVGVWRPLESRLHLSLGRQLATDLPSLSVFDGAAVALRLRHVDFGVLSGTQPDPSDYGWSSRLREHAAFLRLHSAPQERESWSLSAGYVSAYDDGEIDRDYLALQAQSNLARLSFYLSQELDYNRGWRRDAEGSDFSWTNSYAHARYRLRDELSLHGGFDNRRNIRLYRDHVTPETEFDDAYRQGMWVGFTQRHGRALRYGADLRRSTGASSSDANNITAHVGLHKRVRTDLRSTWFDRDDLQGWMHSLRLGTNLTRQLHVELGGGTRDERSLDDSSRMSTLSWTSVSLDYSLGYAWYLTLSAERSSGQGLRSDQLYATTTYRF